ncbi:unnamed protein product [Penicillium glandicola]
MSEPKDPLDLAETGHLSKLRATLAHTKTEEQPNPTSPNGTNRQAENSEVSNELDFDFDLGTDHYPLGNLRSLQQVFDAVQYHKHLEREQNFSPATRVECFRVDSQGGEWRTLDEASMDQLLQGSPLSIYVRHDITRDLTTYIISHKELDTSITTLKSILNIALNVTPVNKPAVFLDDPFDIHTILSTLSFESSKFHVKRFQRFMWIQMNKLEDHLLNLESSDRAKSGELTKKLQLLSSNAYSHIANAEVAIITAQAIQNAHSRLVPSLSQPNPFANQRTADSISYIISCMEKQKLWFLNYQQRIDSNMSLAYNLVAQKDAINNIQISHSMKQDSTSMNAIAAMTMIFLPGTFAGTVVGAGVFGGAIKETVWLIWVAITAPLTVVVMVCWWWYKRAKHPMVKEE